MFGYVYRKYEFNHNLLYCLYIKHPEIESVTMFSCLAELELKLNQYKNLNLSFNPELTPPYNIIVAYLEAAYGNGGYLCSNVKSHQIYITCGFLDKK